MKEVLKIAKEKRTKYIGARFTKSEKEDIENIADLLNMNNSDLVRDALFSHINQPLFFLSSLLFLFLHKLLQLPSQF